jgi:hypothetical protein
MTVHFKNADQGYEREKEQASEKHNVRDLFIQNLSLEGTHGRIRHYACNKKDQDRDSICFIDDFNDLADPPEFFDVQDQKTQSEQVCSRWLNTD